MWCVCVIVVLTDYFVSIVFARVRVPENYLGMVISEELKMEWFIPTLTGPGVVTVAMLDLLVGVHNYFIEKSLCMLSLKKGQKTDSQFYSETMGLSLSGSLDSGTLK